MIVHQLVKKLEDELSRWLDPHLPKHTDIIEKGYLLYIQGMVRSLRKDGKGLVANVQDVSPVQVRINHPLIYDSECTCPAPFPCKHQVAVFFHLYGKEQSVPQWINRWKKNIQEGQQMSESKIYTRGEKIRLTEEERNALSVYQHGVELVEQTFLHGEKNRLDSFHSFYLYSKITNALNGKSFYQWEYTALSDLVVQIHSLYRVIELAQQKKQEWESEQLVHTLMFQIDQAIGDLPKPAPFSFDLVYEKLVEDLREIVFLEEPFPYEILVVYWELWNTVFTRSRLRKKELAFAKETVKKCIPDSIWHVVHSFQWCFQGDMKAAMEALEPAAMKHFRIVFLYSDLFRQQKKWKEFDKIMPFFLKHYKAFFDTLSYKERQRFVDQVMSNFSDYFGETNQSHVLEEILYGLLPFSAKPLSDFFFSRKEYKKLVELYIFANLPISAIGQDVLREIQKNDAESVLPLYHRAVTKAISEKNRTSYKRAVRYLKKLRTIYRKLKEEDRWNDYFSNMISETKRLRAFQEECRKGKLINE